MATWIRFSHDGSPGFGILDGDEITVHKGDMFAGAEATDIKLLLGAVTLMTPCTPTKLIGLWNNFHATAEKTGLPHPEHPWYFVKTPNTYAPGNTVITRPTGCSGKIVFEGELGVVIGRRCKEVSVDAIGDYIFGYTCVNDVTAVEHLFSEEKFAHWTRAKSFDGFGVFGPGITQRESPDSLVIKTFLEHAGDVQERQNYPVSDMIYSPFEAVSRISHDMTLMPGDVIACGTSVGAGAMKDGWRVRVLIDGVGELVNTYRQDS